MDFLLLTSTAVVLPPSRSYCHNRTGNDSRATQPPQTSVCFVFVLTFLFNKLLSLSFLMKAISDTFVFRQKTARAKQ